jgi:hypothetical protein
MVTFFYIFRSSLVFVVVRFHCNSIRRRRRRRRRRITRVVGVALTCAFCMCVKKLLYWSIDQNQLGRLVPDVNLVDASIDSVVMRSLRSEYRILREMMATGIY